MSHRLTPASSKPAPMLSLRLPEDLQAALVGVKDALARATPGLEPSLTDAVRVLLREALAARAAHGAVPGEAQRDRQEAPRGEPERAPPSPRVLAQRARSVLIAAELAAEIERARALPAKLAAEDALVAKLRAREQLREGAVTHTAADGQLSLLTRTANDTRAIDADELRRRLVATKASTRVIAAATGLGKSAVAKFMGGGPAGATVLAALDGFVSQAQP